MAKAKAKKKATPVQASAGTEPAAPAGATEGNGQAQAPANQFTLQKVYLKDASFESPMSPGVFTQSQSPQVDVQMNIEHQRLDQSEEAGTGFYEVVLVVTVTSKIEGDIAFLCEMQQAGIFQVRGMEEEAMGYIIDVACPNILLPFAREAVSETVQRGGFPQLLINPVNFEALYMQGRAQAEAAGSEGQA
ncbi:MAG: protein-export chaperone SecB [Gammaproteobacteria bacterium]|nr:protein-export chaperone SecB [Gammaproteobacteria bacterium]